MKLGDKLCTVELQEEEFTILHPDNTVVCQVRISRASIEEEEEAAKEQEVTEGGDAATADAPEAPAES